MFQGRISTVDKVGRTQATLTVASDLVILDYDMPRNLFSPTCVHTLYDSGCGVIRGTYAASGTAGRGLDVEHDQLSRRAARARAGLARLHVRRQRQRARDGQERRTPASALNLMYPLPFAPAPGDAFTVYAGCDHTQATCQGTVQQPGQLPRLPLRAAAADGLLTHSLPRARRHVRRRPYQRGLSRKS